MLKCYLVQVTDLEKDAEKEYSGSTSENYFAKDLVDLFNKISCSFRAKREYLLNGIEIPNVMHKCANCSEEGV